MPYAYAHFTVRDNVLTLTTDLPFRPIRQGSIPSVSSPATAGLECLTRFTAPFVYSFYDKAGRSAEEWQTKKCQI